MTMRATLYPELAERTEGLGRRGQVLAGIWAGKGTKEIAAELGVSPRTVEYHRERLYRIFGVHDLVSLCRRAIAVGLIDVKSGVLSPTEKGRRKAASRKRRAKRTMPEAMPEAMPDALPTHMRSGAERDESAGAASASFERICKFPSNLKGPMPEAMPEAMPHACQSESESESESDKRQV